jgi:hypothetical protein
LNCHEHSQYLAHNTDMGAGRGGRAWPGILPHLCSILKLEIMSDPKIILKWLERKFVSKFYGCHSLSPTGNYVYATCFTYMDQAAGPKQ